MIYARNPARTYVPFTNWTLVLEHAKIRQEVCVSAVGSVAGSIHVYSKCSTVRRIAAFTEFKLAPKALHNSKA